MILQKNIIYKDKDKDNFSLIKKKNQITIGFFVCNKDINDNNKDKLQFFIYNNNNEKFESDNDIYNLNLIKNIKKERHLLNKYLLGDKEYEFWGY